MLIHGMTRTNLESRMLSERGQLQGTIHTLYDSTRIQRPKQTNLRGSRLVVLGGQGSRGWSGAAKGHEVSLGLIKVFWN